MKLLEIIKSRRSIRKYKKETISDHIVEDILEAAKWAPSGLNNQPWRFVLIKDQTYKMQLSDLTHYSAIILNCVFCIAVFYNKPSGYHREKDIMSIGACIQNMLLQAHSHGIGSVWLGEILKNSDRVNEILGIEPVNELMALVSFGYPDEQPNAERYKINEILLKTC